MLILSGNHDVAVGTVGQIAMEIMSGLKWSQSMGDIFDNVIFNPDLYCSLK